MHRLLGACLLVAVPLCGQEDRPRIERLRADVFFLASPALQGRRSLARGAETAAEWVASEFAKAGLKPVAGTSFLQPLPVIECKVDFEKTGLTVRRGTGENTLRFPNAVSFSPQDIHVKGGVVFAGYGISAPELGYDDYAGLDVRGKFVLVFDHEPQEDDPGSPFLGKGATLYANQRTKATIAKNHGAAALVVTPEPNRKHPSLMETVTKVPGMIDRFTRRRSQVLEDDAYFFPVFLVDTAAAEGMATGATLAELQASIDKTLKPASRVLPGVELEARVVLAERRRAQTANVLGMIEGTDSLLKDETILVGAHYDHLGLGEEFSAAPLQTGMLHPGADDNASGTAGVVELARVLSANAKKPRRTIVFAAFGAEERGLLGSRYYVAHPPRPLEKTRAIVNLDMIGRNETALEQTKELFEVEPDTSDTVNLVGTAYCPDCRKTVERLNGEAGLKISYKWDTETRQNMISRSDHYPFAAKGVPFVFLFTGMHANYHRPEDKADKLNYGKMVRILVLTKLVLAEWADTAEPPRFKPLGR